MGEFDNTWPKSVRLNIENRQKFVKAVLEDVMPGDKKPTNRAFAEQWGQKVYDDIYGPLKEQMDALPKWMWTKNDEFNCDVFHHESKTSEWKNEDGIVEFQLNKNARMVNESNVYHWNRCSDEVLAILPDDHEVIQAYKDHINATKDWNSQYQELNATLAQVSDACNTSHQLFRAWPKAVKYAQECFPYQEPAEAKRGGQTDISSEQLDLTAKIAQATAGAAVQN